ncbi:MULTISPECIES: restriction endonuclease subunit S [Psychrobacter]|uniref:restriction endonuclease subunit S n=1 Tax=Psychrobacter TaxID=497 RepID=UPI00186825C1|nr:MULTISPECIES: restriction endonuclease subunit S [Psychrobacter]
MQSKIERYTPSDVGVVPADWSTPLLSEVSTLITNGFVGTASPYYVDEHEGIPYFFGKNVRANKLDPIGIRYITPEFHEKQSKTALKTGDLLTVQSGHIGETAVVTEEYDNTNCHALIVTRLKQDLISPIFLSYYINSEIGKARLKGLEVGSTILHINTKDLKKFRIIQPSLPEQQKIAKILTTWDKAIDSTERLIDNSKQQKKALMQQLLTGKKRLLDENGKRFEGEWEKKSIDEVAKVITGSTPSTKNSDYYGGEYLFVSPADLGVSKYINQTAKTLTDLGIEKTRLIPKGSSLFTCIGSTIGKLGLAGRELATNQQINSVLSKKSYSNEYVYYQLLLNAKKIQNSAAVQAVPIINKTNFESQLLFFPPFLQEQQKIAAVLTNADKEIELLEQQLADLQQEKKALMQVLLTGKKRVVVDGEVV